MGEPYLDPVKHGFVNDKSCATQMVLFTHNLAFNLNNKENIIFFDFPKPMIVT